MAHLVAEEMAAREAIARDRNEQEEIKKILRVYGEDSCWQGYEPKINQIRMATYHRKKQNPISERILKEINSQ